MSRASERSIILAVTIGSIFEWYEVFLYVYWAPIIVNELFDVSLLLTETINAVSVFAIGFIARPLGGVIFGYIGDKWGRKNSFILSLFVISIPSFAIALIPSFSTWSHFALIFVGLMKFLQGIPAGGEVPGAMCYLAESSAPERRRYMCSFAFMGAQIGQLLSMAECLLLKSLLSHEALITWGWRLSFLVGGALGIFGFYLRRKMHESPAFQHLKSTNDVSHNPLKDTFKKYKKKILIGFLISIFEVVGYFMITIFPVEYFSKIFGLTSNQELVLSCFLLLLCIVFLPIFGKIGDKYRNKPLFILSALGVMVFSVPYYFAIANSMLWLTIILEMILIVFFSIQFALLPSLLTEYYPTSVRFTCIGFSFNICDSIVGGLAPIFAIVLIEKSANPALFAILFPISAIIFLASYLSIKMPDRKATY